jgi:hypothetical protein
MSKKQISELLEMFANELLTSDEDYLDIVEKYASILRANQSIYYQSIGEKNLDKSA